MLLTIATERTKLGIIGVIRDADEKVIQVTAKYDDKRDAYRAAKELREMLTNIRRAA